MAASSARRSPKAVSRASDTGAALAVKGVLQVLTHEHRPPMADNDQAYKDEVAPAGSPFRPLYDSRIMFNGQPIALVIAETSEIARFAASLVRVEYDRQAHVTDLHGQRDWTVLPPAATNPMEAGFLPPKPGAARPPRRWRRPPCATRPNIMCRSNITIRWSSTPRRQSSRATAGSRSMTRPRAW